MLCSCFLSVLREYLAPFAVLGLASSSPHLFTAKHAKAAKILPSTSNTTELRTGYLLAHYPPQNLSDSDFRCIQVSIQGVPSNAGYNVRHRSGYYTWKEKDHESDQTLKARTVVVFMLP